MKNMIIALLFSNLLYATGFSCEPTIHAPIKTEIHNGYARQVATYNLTHTGEISSHSGNLQFIRTNKGTCHITSYFYIQESPTVEAWVQVNNETRKVKMDFRYTYGAEYRATFPCPSYDALQVSFAFDLGEGRWDNNAGYNYQANLSEFNL